jgi:hypothetical protein
MSETKNKYYSVISYMTGPERLACFNAIRDDEGVVRLLFKDVNHAKSCVCEIYCAIGSGCYAVARMRLCESVFTTLVNVAIAY